ncbi:MAG: DUF4440 domain-containing protein [Betaproteobacteria bacterium]|nr:MAG: DUF4440 domain-containing protein [Betaproteobacteria bacterium]
MKYVRLLLICWAMLLSAVPYVAPYAAPYAAPVDEARLNSLLTALEVQSMAMGGVAVGRGDAPPYVRNIGSARLQAGAEQAARADTRYRIGSISKLLTAIMVLQLVDEGALSLETPLKHWFPELALAERITVADLLAHRSGLGDIKDLPDFDRHWMFEPRREAELIQAISGMPRRFEPGTKAVYNNSGYLLLSFIVEKAGARPYGEALQARLVRPLRLQDTSFDITSGLKPGEAASYRWENQWTLVRATDPSVPQGAGGVVSSPRDLVQIIRALFRNQLLKPATLQRMLAVKDSFGLGIYPLPGVGPQAWGHEGVIDGFSATLAYFPQADIAMAWCGNAHQLPRDVLVAALRSAVFKPDAPLPTYAPKQVRVEFSVDAGRPVPDVVSVRGNATPLSWKQNWPLARDAATGLWQGQVALTVRDGMPFEFKYLKGEDKWETTPNRSLLAVPGQSSRTNDVFNQNAAYVALRQEVLEADDKLFAAYNRRDVTGMAAVFSERLEFFHDNGGLSSYRENLAAFETIFKTNEPVRRDRVAADQEVFPLGEFGAYHGGSHRFCRTARQPESCQTYRYANVWERTADGLRLLRVISFDH